MGAAGKTINETPPLADMEGIVAGELRRDPGDVEGAARVILGAMGGEGPTGLQGQINQALGDIFNADIRRGPANATRVQAELGKIKTGILQRIIATIQRLHGKSIQSGTARAKTSRDRIIKNLVRTANRLDEAGRVDEADQVDRVVTAFSKGDPRAPEMLKALGARGAGTWGFLSGLGVSAGAALFILGSPLLGLAAASAAGYTLYNSPKLRDDIMVKFTSLEDRVQKYASSLAKNVGTDAFYTQKTAYEINRLDYLLGSYGNEEFLAFAGGANSEEKIEMLRVAKEALSLAKKGGKGISWKWGLRNSID